MIFRHRKCMNVKIIVMKTKLYWHYIFQTTIIHASVEIIGFVFYILDSKWCGQEKVTLITLSLCVEVLVDHGKTRGFRLGRFIIHHFPKKTFINRCHDRYKRYIGKICVSLIQMIERAWLLQSLLLLHNIIKQCMLRLQSITMGCPNLVQGDSNSV